MSAKPGRTPPSAPSSESGAPPVPALSPQQAAQVAALAARLKEGAPAAPEHPKSTLTSEAARARAHAYWATLGPLERRIRTLSGRIAIGERARAELDALLAQLAAQQDQPQPDASDGGGS